MSLHPPINDEGCLGTLTAWVIQLRGTDAVRTVARRLGTRANVVDWIQGKPQRNDRGEERYRVLTCDVAQRLRLFCDDPNCVERAADAALLLEVLDGRNQRAFVTARAQPRRPGERGQRHTALVELDDTGQWEPLDLFSRVHDNIRNADSRETGEDVLRGFHQFVGKPLLGLFGSPGRAAADALGAGEEEYIYRKRKPSSTTAAQSSSTAAPQADSPRPTSSPSSGTTRRPPSATERPRLTDDATPTEGDDDGGNEISTTEEYRDYDPTAWRW